MSSSDKTAHNETDGEYIPPKVWVFESQGGIFGGTNRPTAGPRDDVELPRGSHPLQLYSLGTPNGVKVTMLLEELNLRYGLEYDAFTIQLSGEQFGKGFTNANPNSKIPALLHYRDGPDAAPLRVFESAAIIMYLCEQFDTDHAFLPSSADNPALRAECLSWLFFVQGSVPFLGGGFGHFYNYAPVKIKYPVDRYTMETKRQLDVLNRRLGGLDGGDGGPYLCGDTYTVADMSAFPWYGCVVQGKLYSAAEFLSVNEYEHVLEWANLLSKRLAYHRGRMVNSPWNDEDETLLERHNASDFDSKRALL